ncbi:MAG TPA: molybdopterin-dependent oxidoreductase [Dermatophilaceae bacterium]|nr:molybdopterin-dependent oxidoreductase [Dermatophilaceae bacterium]
MSMTAPAERVDHEAPTSNDVPTFCPLCVSRCGATATVADGVLTSLRPDPTHPTGAAICVKGKAAPELVAHSDRLTHPLRRTQPKGAPDPGWEQITWDEALDTAARKLNELAREHGPECVVFGSSSPSTSAMSDAVDWLSRLRRAFGSPNLCVSMELCGWGRYLAPMYTYGAPVPGAYMPDLEQAGCILYWGYNPSVARLAHATATTAALRRGARLVVVDPRRAGLASKADHWLRVRPGTDTALALSITHVMIANGWFDVEFVRRWTNAPLLVRDDTGRLLRQSEVIADGDVGSFVAWDGTGGVPVVYDPATASYGVSEDRLALDGAREVPTNDGVVTCRPVFELIRRGCAAMAPEVAERVTGVSATTIAETAQTLWEARPVAFYAWSGVEQHSNATQTARAIGQLYALTGCFDAPGGNVLFAPVPTNPIDGAGLLSAGQRAKAIGLERRPLGPPRFEFVTGEDFYRAALEGDPYRVRALVNFGTNYVMSHPDSLRGRDALAALDFFVHADLFMSPTAELADIVLPVTTPFEAEGLRTGFEISAAAQSLVQLRQRLVKPRGEARSDLQVIFALAVRLGLADQFFDGDIDAAWTHQLAPSGVTLEQLRANPAGVRVPVRTAYRKFAHAEGGQPRGFPTASRKVELWSETLAEHGYPPLPVYDEPAISPVSRADLARQFPLILTCAKSLRFCESQHRNIASLRGPDPDPEVELHPSAAGTRGIHAGDWVTINTPHGSVRARAKLNTNLDPDVVCGQHGWWQACADVDQPGYPPYGPGSANLNLVLRQGPSDPISGSAPLRASLCEITLA